MGSIPLSCLVALMALILLHTIKLSEELWKPLVGSSSTDKNNYFSITDRVDKTVQSDPEKTIFVARLSHRTTQGELIAGL